MAEQGRREVVGDPLALNPAAQMADRSLATIGVRNPGKSGGQDAIFAQQMGLMDAMSGLATAVNKVIETKADEWQTEGKLAYMQGKTEEEIRATGNKYTMQGWQSLAAVEGANQWYANELTNIQNGADRMDPNSYSQLLMQRRADYLKDLPDDPAIRKVYAAAFDDLGSRLTMQHTEAHNKYNTVQTENSFIGMVTSGAKTNADVSRVVPGATPLALSPGVVRQTVAFNDNDVDVLTRTILGEAGGEGPTGMAAVAHVIVNRAIDGSYGKGITGVAKADKQFSTWNTGAGGNNPGKYDPGSAGYQAAKNIALAVLQGHHIDPTNGATHFYSEVGMDKLVRDGHQTNRVPAWWNEQAGKSGGGLTIGRHKFAGRANCLGSVYRGDAEGAKGGNQAGGGILKFVHAGQETLDGVFSGILTDASAALGKNLTITSGYRSPEHNANVGGAKGSRHQHGDAADIDMKGMSPNERAELVQTLRAKGVRRFGTYDNHPDMLHVDMSDKNGQNWFMHNKSNGNMAKAPEWFKQVSASPIPQMDANTTAGPGAAAKPGAEVNATTSLQYDPYTGPSTSTMEAIRSDPMPGPRKGELLGQAMFTELQAGDITTFNESGGIGMLQELGAPQSVIRQVQQAKKAYDKEQLNKFDSDKLKWENDLTLKVGSGELSAEDALDQINARHSQASMTDEQAKSLASRVMAESARLGKQPNMSYEVMDATTKIFTAVNMGTLSPKDADQQLRDLAQVHDIPTQQLNTFVARMWAENDQGLEKQRQAVRVAEAKRIEQDGRKDMVRTALSNGEGLTNLSGIGTIEDFDPKANAVRAYSPVQWGVKQLADNFQAAARSSIPARMEAGLSQSDAEAAAKAEADRAFHDQLKRHGVIDESLQSQLTAVFSGNIIHNGQIDEDAVDAFDMYVQLSNNPEIGESYMAQYFKDPASRNLVENAKALYAENFGLEQALRKSAEILDQNKWTPEQRINADVQFNTVVSTQLSEQIDKVTGNDGWFRSAGISDAERKAAVEDNGQLRAMVERRARAYHAMNPMNLPEVNIKRAANDVLKDAFVVGGSFVMPMTRDGQRIDQAMGIPNMAKDLPNQLISEKVYNYWLSERTLREKTGADARGWGSIDLPMFGYGSAAMNEAENRKARATGATYEEFKKHNPSAVVPFHAEYNPTDGTMRIRLWKDQSRTELADAKPMILDLSEVGAEYITKKTQMQEDDGPGPFQRLMNWVTE